MHELSRRRLLQVGSTGTVASIAGCGQLTPGDSQNSQSGDDSPSDPGDSQEPSTVTLIISPDEDEIASLQQQIQEIQQQAAAGEISREEATSRQETVTEEANQLIADTVGGIETHASETDGLSVTDTLEQQGAVLVEGNPAVLIALLDRADVDGLFAEGRFEEFSQQDQNQP